VRIAADANVLLSAVLGGRAKDILPHPDIEEAVTAETTFREVQEYASQLARKKRLSLDVVLLAVATLPVRVVPREDYVVALPQAEKRIGKRDPDDIEILALALHLKIPIRPEPSLRPESGPMTTISKMRVSSGIRRPSY